MKKILKLMLVATFGMLLFSSCQEGETSMPEMKAGAVKNMMLVEGADAMIPALNPSGFSSALTLDVISDDEPASVQLYVEFFRIGSGFRDTAEWINQTTFPATNELSLQDLADLFPDSSSVILNDLDGGDVFTVYTGNIIMADGREIKDEYSYFVEAVSENTGNDTIIELNPTGHSPALQNIGQTVWLTQYIYYVGCPTDLGGTYDMTATGEGGYGLGAPSAWTSNFTEATITQISELNYTIEPAIGGLMVDYYAAFGAQVMTGEIMDVCGTLMAAGLNDGWNAPAHYEGTVDEATGVITIEWENPWGDWFTMILTPQ
ncbi:MAG: hypothetical protein K8R31_01180 [Bacteroidales bacterium]|nr:hypothetical protein [Bacteroidales bacterium]